MTGPIFQTQSMEEAIFEVALKHAPPEAARKLTDDIIKGMGAYVAGLTQDEYLTFARTLLQQGYAYAVEANYPLGTQQALALAHDQLLAEERKQ